MIGMVSIISIIYYIRYVYMMYVVVYVYEVSYDVCALICMRFTTSMYTRVYTVLTDRYLKSDSGKLKLILDHLNNLHIYICI